MSKEELESSLVSIEKQIITRQELSEEDKIYDEEVITICNLKATGEIIREDESKVRNIISTITYILLNTALGTAINFTNVKVDELTKRKYKNTIEFRIPNGTANEIVWQNYINTLVKFLLAQIDIDEDFLDYQIEMKNIPTPITYREIYLRKALELADLIFQSNTDKIYFLNQYLKQAKGKSKVFKI